MNLKKIFDSVEPICDMARITKGCSGLTCLILVSPNFGNNTGKHNQPRIKFQNNTSDRFQKEFLIPISIDKKNPQVLVDYDTTILGAKEINRIKQWIIKNYDVLIKYYNDEIYEEELFNNIKRID